MQRQDGRARGVGRVGGRPRRVLDRRKLLVAADLQQRDVLGQRERVKDEQLQLDALGPTAQMCEVEGPVSLRQVSIPNLF